MKKNRDLTKESFDELLEWLSPKDPDRGAAAKYEEIRSRLINIFYFRGCSDPESLADETINRVAEKIKKLKTEFVGEPAKYFYAVANKIYLESVSPKNRRLVQLDHPIENTQGSLLIQARSQLESGSQFESDAAEAKHVCLEECLGKLQEPDRKLILQYYNLDKREKIDDRLALANKMGISLNLLRVKVYRLKNTLEKCLQKCLAEK